MSQSSSHLVVETLWYEVMSDGSQAKYEVSNPESTGIFKINGGGGNDAVLTDPAESSFVAPFGFQLVRCTDGIRQQQAMHGR